MSDDKKDKLTFIQLLQSVFAALIGIQSEEKRKEDFEKITPAQVLMCGVLLMLIFFGTVMAITRILLATLS